jgi:ornithine--oxo-acid transaminase
MITSMMSGSEATESAVKIARKWAYTVKGIPRDTAWILTTSHCFHGLTLATMPLSDVIADGMINQE